MVLSRVGDVFAIRMHNDEMGDYEMSNHIVEFEVNRRITWEPVMTAATRAEDQADLGDKADHRWSYELTPVEEGSTLVTKPSIASGAFRCRPPRVTPLPFAHFADPGCQWRSLASTSLARLASAIRVPVSLSAAGTPSGIPS